MSEGGAMRGGRSYLALAGWVAVSLAAGAIGAVVSGPDVWYEALDKPAWTPPNGLFGPVWTVLYVLMGVAAWLVWERRHTVSVGRPLTLFAAQLGLNAAWSWLFFGFHRPDLAFAEIVVLWAAIAATAAAFGRVWPAAGGLLLPYLGWVTFATALNGSIWLRNG
ncbi:MAG: TspO/MBR family protein [Gemmataceae bacterium]